MPILTAPISEQGLIVPIAISVSQPRCDALTAAGVQVPRPMRGRGLIDTGASCSAVDRAVIQSLGLSATGSTTILTPSTGTESHECSLFDVALVILMGSAQKHTPSATTAVIEATLSGQGFHALIGRDVLSQGLLVYDGKAGNLSLAF